MTIQLLVLLGLADSQSFEVPICLAVAGTESLHLVAPQGLVSLMLGHLISSCCWKSRVLSLSRYYYVPLYDARGFSFFIGILGTRDDTVISARYMAITRIVGGARTRMQTESGTR